MKREIKFRAWDKEESRMCYFNEYGNYPSGLLFTSKDSTYRWKNLHVLMQYTGLHDKNGKEIYEGDILKESDNELVFAVEYDSENGGYFMPKTYDPEYAYTIGAAMTDVEIIGNIYESPSLLTN